jgi:TonB family protein
MSAPSFVVTTLINGQEKSQLWDASLPLPIGFPFRWVVERTADGVRVRDVASPPGEVRSDGVRSLTREMIERGETISLPRAGDETLGDIRFRIRPVRSLRPAPEQVAPEAGGELQIYASIGHWLTHSEKLGARYVGHVERRPAFTLTREDTAWRLDAAIAGLVVRNGSERNVAPGACLRLTADELSHATIAHGTLAWSFARVSVSGFVDAHRPAATDDEALRFRKAMIGSGATLLALLLAAQLWPKPDEEELVPAQFTQLVMKPAAPAASAPAAAVTSTTATTAAPRKAEQTAVAQAFRAKALQSAVSGLLKGGMTSLLAQSDFVAGRGGGARTLDAKSKALQSTGDIALAASKTDVKVAALGGSAAGAAGGVGYAKGEGASVKGQGKTQIAMDTSGSSVAEGLTKDEVGEVIHRHLSEVRYCYESAMLRTPDIEGKLMVAFTIGGQGAVTAADVKQSTLPDPRLDDCILRRLVSWKFPKPRGGVDVAVTYPFIFKTLGR